MTPLLSQGKKLSPSNQKRLQTLSQIVYAIIWSGRCGLHQIGDHLPDLTDLESRVKKTKRFLDSKYTDWQSYFLPLLVPFLHRLAQQGTLVLAIDGSAIGKHCTALMISVAWKKRALPLCWVVRQCGKGHLPTEAHLDVLQQLQQFLPPDCQVVLVGDGEFDSIDIQAFCAEAQWQYVLRTAKTTLIQTADGEQFAIGAVDVLAPTTPIFITEVYFTAQKYGLVNCIAAYNATKQEAMYWVTNIDYGPDAIAAYNLRFGIETIFGDIKSRGFHIHKTRIADPKRISNLLLMVGIAFLLVFTLGTFQKELAHYLPQIIRKDRIQQYSTFQIGLRMAQYFIKKQIVLLDDFCKQFDKYICVRL